MQTDVNFATQTNGRLTLARFDNVAFATQSVPIPSLAATFPSVNNGRIRTQMPVQRLEYAPMSITFMVQSNFANYRALSDWMQSAPKLTVQETFSDGRLVLLDNQNKPLGQEIAFVGMFPTALSEIALRTDQPNSTYLYATATFEYLHYEWK